MVTENDMLLSMRDLTVELPTTLGYRPVLRDISFDVSAGETLGIVGESGSGKSMTSLAIMGLLPSKARISHGSVCWLDRELIGMDNRQLRNIRGKDIGMIFQEPASCLNPAFTVGDQIAETLKEHTNLSRTEISARVLQLLIDVGIPDPTRRKNDYPHQFSGGMAQRIMIAMAIACGPRLLIADEPTTALDVTLQAEILALLDGLTRSQGIGLIIISHDLGVIASIADRIIVMYAGEIVEEAPGSELFSSPKHPYTEALINARPHAGNVGRQLRSIPSFVPSIANMPEGCRFNPRCAYALDKCKNGPISLVDVGHERTARCIRHDEIELSGLGHVADHDETLHFDRLEGSQEVVLKVSNVSKHYPIRSAVLRRKVGEFEAVKSVNLYVRTGETLGLVGESGSGKSTTGRMVAGLLEITSGTIRFGDINIATADRDQMRSFRKKVQIVSQDPYGSFNPQMQVGESIIEPLIQFGAALSQQTRKVRMLDVLDSVKLPQTFAHRYPPELSGGQLQRLAIARALISRPDLIVCDEAVSSLDASSQASVMNLLQELQERLHVAYLFISHDLNVVRHISDRIVVMNEGEIVEAGDTSSVLENPKHAYTRKLLSAVIDLAHV